MPRATEPAARGERPEPWIRRAGHVLRRIVGAPDYEAYLAHCRRAGHPARLTAEEYLTEFFESRGTGVRCC